ncbi:HCMVUL22, partial [Human betaherpesvirus 5]
TGYGKKPCFACRIQKKKDRRRGVFRAKPYSFLIKNKVVNIIVNPWGLLLLNLLFIFFGLIFFVFISLLWLLMFAAISVCNQNVILPGVIFVSVGGGPPLTESYVLAGGGITTISAGTGLFHRHAAKTR